KVLGKIGESAVPALLDAVRQPKGKQSRREALRALGHAGAAAQPALPVLVEALADPDPVPAQEALANLRVIALPALADALKHKNARIRYGAMTAVSRIKPSVKESAPLLTAALKNEDVIVRRAAAVQLTYLTEAAQEVVPPLALALTDVDAQVRAAAAAA